MGGETRQYSQLSSELRGAIMNYMAAKGQRLDNETAAAVARAAGTLDDGGQEALAKRVNVAAVQMKSLRTAVTDRLRPTKGQDGSAALDASVSLELDKLTRNKPELQVENLVENPKRASQAIQGMIDSELAATAAAASVSSSLDVLAQQFREMEKSKTGTGGIIGGPGFTPPGNAQPPSKVR